MKNKRTITIIGSVLLSSLLASGIASAETSVSNTKHNRGMMRNNVGNMMERGSGVMGTVSAISGNTITLTSKSFNNTSTQTIYTIDASKATVNKNGSVSSVSGIVVGDTIRVDGTITGTNVVATTIHDGMMQGKGNRMENEGTDKKGGNSLLTQGNGQPVIGGVVSSINGTILVVTNKSGIVYTINAGSATTTKSGAISTLSNVLVGDNVVVQGAINGNSITASSVIDNGPTPTPTTNSTMGMGTKTRDGFMNNIGSFFSRMFGF